MGMGEPLDNIDAVFRSLRILVEPHGLYLAQRRLSISTAGHADGILRLARELPGVNLALALHSTDEAKRQSIMPITKTWSLATLKNALREYLSSGGRGLLLQYLLAEGFNDSQDDAHQLIEWSRDLKAKVNLIPFNPVECDFPIPLRAPSSDNVQRFKDALHHAGLRVMLRISKGQDIGGACGQLAADNFVNNKKSRNLTRD
jgi:23S rRNA (adenine2503-C2)-methyltransferase